MKRTASIAELTDASGFATNKKIKKDKKKIQFDPVFEALYAPTVSISIFYYLPNLKDKMTFAMMNKNNWSILGEEMLKMVVKARKLVNATFTDFLNYNALHADFTTIWKPRGDLMNETAEFKPIRYTKRPNPKHIDTEPVLQIMSRNSLRDQNPRRGCHPCAGLLSED
jgi:hypothetical protein